jgi:hypothetical protein
LIQAIEQSASFFVTPQKHEVFQISSFYISVIEYFFSEFEFLSSNIEFLKPKIKYLKPIIEFLKRACLPPLRGLSLFQILPRVMLRSPTAKYYCRSAAFPQNTAGPSLSSPALHIVCGTTQGRPLQENNRAIC